MLGKERQNKWVWLEKKITGHQHEPWIEPKAHYPDEDKQEEKRNPTLLEVLSPILFVFVWLAKGRPAVGNKNVK